MRTHLEHRCTPDTADGLLDELGITGPARDDWRRKFLTMHETHLTAAVERIARFDVTPSWPTLYEAYAARLVTIT